jgi:hypothetical protein
MSKDKNDSRNEKIQRFMEEQRKESAHNGSALLSLFIVGTIGLAAGAALSEVAKTAPQLSSFMNEDLLLFLALASGGPAIIFGMLARLQRMKAGRLSGETQGVVSASRIGQQEGGTKTMGPRTNVVRCTVSYEVHGKPFTTSWEPGGPIAAVDKHLGRRVMVCFDPQKAEDAEVKRPSRSYRGLLLAYGGFMALCGAFIYLRHPLF